MTWVLVQKSAAVDTSINTGTTTPALPGGSRPGTPLVAFLGSSNGGNVFTGPAGWVQGPSVGSGPGSSRCEIWYQLYNPGGITSASFSSGTGGSVRGALAEFSTDQANITVDSSGTGTADTTTSCTVSGVTSHGTGLAVCCFLEHLASSSSVTWTDPAGFTLADSLTASGQNQLYAGYSLTPPNGSLSVTGTTSVTSGANGWTGCVLAFNALPPIATFAGGGGGIGAGG